MHFHGKEKSIVQPMGKQGKRYIPSKFAHILKVDPQRDEKDEGIYAIYHALNMEVIFTGKSLAKLFINKDGLDINPKSMPLKGFTQQVFSIDSPPKDMSKNLWEDFFKALLSKGLIVPESIREGLFLEDLQNKKEFIPIVRIRLMYLMPTYECNLACKYCSIASALKAIKPEEKGHMMTKDIAFRAIDLFFKLFHPFLKNYKIIFYGGEPLLNWPVIEASLKYIAEKNHELTDHAGNYHQVRCALLSNGVLMNRHIATVLKKYHCSVSISVDGPQVLHDRFRLDKRGQGSFQKSMDAIEILRESGLQPSISCTLPRPNVEDIDAICHFFRDRLKIKSIGFNPIRNLPEGSLYFTSPEKITTALLKAFKYFREAGIYEDRIMRKVRAFAEKKFYAQDCAAYGCQIAVGPEGKVGPCHILLSGKSQIIGAVDDADIMDKIQKGSLMSTWARRKPLFMEACGDCLCLGICGGGCAAESLKENETIFAMDRNFCIHTKMVLQWMINDLYLNLFKR